MESRFKARISGIFRSSFGSCRSRNISDVIGEPVFVAQNHQDLDHLEPLSPKPEILPSISKPTGVERKECGVTVAIKKEVFRRKISDRGIYFVSSEKEGRTCPPASPISPGNSIVKLHEMQMRERKPKKKTNKPTEKKKQDKKKEVYRLSFSSLEPKNNGWFSSEDETEDETERFFSSKSFSSDSSSSHLRSRRNTQRRRRRICKKKSSEVVNEDMVEESVAVVKRSSDPYHDFRTSMVEMIIEKQIFSAKDLEKLLQCFLSLNASLHHRIIVEVFTEIWETLFS